jgi:hypothetical protein
MMLPRTIVDIEAQWEVDILGEIMLNYFYCLPL